MKESTIESYLVKRVKALGGEVRKVQWVGRVGAPDRVVMLPGVSKQQRDGGWLYCNACVVWVELKAPNKEPRSSQLREHDRMRKMGQRVVVIDSFEGVDALLS